jgi:Ser/Thr protein kinase RdoA (MazF antagonist)
MSAAAAAAIASAYDLGDPAGDPVYATRGEQGLIWRLDTARGSWAVKELLLPMDEAAAARDVAFQLAAATAGTPLPRPRRTRDGRVVLPAPEAASGWSVRVYEWADLADGRTVTGAEIGAVAARLHRVRHPAPGPAEAWFIEPIGPPAWEAMLSDARRARASWAGALDRWLPQLIALDTAVAPPDPAAMTTCHRDLNLENVRYAAGGGVVVLDWENCGPAQPERELAAIVADIALDVTLPAARDVYVSYRAAGGPAEVRTVADFATAVAIQGHLLQFYSRRALDPDDAPENRARARGRLDHMTRQPLTLDRVDRLLGLLAEVRHQDDGAASR